MPYADGARIASLDESSVANIRGVRVVRKRDFLAVVSANEWDAVRAAKQLKVAWDIPASLAGTAGLFDQMRSAKTTDSVIAEKGDVATALGRAVHVVKATFRGPYQGHMPFGPNCAVADVTAAGTTVMCSTQSVYGTRDKVARVLGVPAATVRVQYFEGAGTFGRSCYDDAAQAAAIVSKEAGAPVRVQFSRADEHGWDNFGPAHLADVKAGVDADGRIVAYEYDGWQHVWSTTETSEQLAFGTPAGESADGTSRNLNKVTLGSMYDIPNLRLNNHRVPGINGYLKASNLRSPLDVSFAFASEQAVDELAHMAGIDPLEFRRRNMSDPRWLAVLDAVAHAARWAPRSAAVRPRRNVVTGRGLGLGTHMSSYGAAIAGCPRRSQHGRGRRDASVRRHRRGARRQSRGGRKPDQRPARPGGEPLVERRSDLLHDKRHQPRLELVSDPALCRDAGCDVDRRAARRSEVHRRWRRDHGCRIGRDRQRVFRRDGRAAARVSVHAAARQSGARVNESAVANLRIPDREESCIVSLNGSVTFLDVSKRDASCPSIIQGNFL